MKQNMRKWTTIGRKGMACLLAVVMMMGFWMPVYATNDMEEPVQVQETTVPTEPAPEIAEVAAVEEDIPYEPVAKGMVSTWITSKSSAKAANANTAGKLEFNKTATLRDDGDYDLKLTLKGSVGEQYSKQMLDVAIVIDRSASMTNESRLATAKAAAKDLIGVLNTNDAVSAMYNIIDFGGSAHTKVNDDKAANTYNQPVADASGWVAGDVANGIINDINIPGTVFSGYNQNATNYEAAIRVLNDQMKNTRSGAMTAVVFLTDGKPTCSWTEIDPTHKYLKERPDAPGYYYFPEDYAYFGGYLSATDWFGTGTSYEGPANTQLCLNVALDDAQNIDADMLFLLGTGTAQLDMLLQLQNAAMNGGKVGESEAVLVSSSGIKDKFNAIAQKLSQLFFTDITITDILSHKDDANNRTLMVDLVPGAEVLVSVYEDGNPNPIAGPAKSVTLDKTLFNSAESAAERTLTTQYNPVNRQLDLVFPDSYKLEPTYTYVLSTVIRPTELAYETYRNNGYDVSGDAATGTHSGKEGFYANDNAYVYYDYAGENNLKEEYAFPVVQLQPGTLVVTKNFSGLTDEEIAALDMSFQVDITYPVDTSNQATEGKKIQRTLTLADMTKNSDGTYTWSIDKLSPGTTFEVAEKGGAVAGYDLTTDLTTTSGEINEKTASGTVDRGQTVTVAYVNNYEVSVTKAKVEKIVTGNMGDKNKDFTFTASLSGRVNSMTGVEYVKNGSGDPVAITADTFTFILKHGEYIEFTKVPKNAVLTVEEDAQDYTLTDVTVTNVPEGETPTREGTSVAMAMTDMVDGHAFTFINDKTVLIDTGIALDSVPYVLILAVVAVGCVFLFQRKRKVEE